MTRLIVQDLVFYQSKNWWVLIFYALFVPFLIAIQGTSVAIAPIAILASVFYLTNTVQSTFAYEEKAHFDRFLKAVPISARRIVWARYLSAILASLAATLVSLVFSTILSIVGPRLFPISITIELDASAPLLWLGTTALISSVIIPMLYRFGYVRARYFLMIPIILSVTLMPLVVTPEATAIWQSVTQNLPGGALSALAAVLFVALLVGSAELSRRIYQRKEA